ERHPVPALAARLARPRDRADAPRDLARLGVEADDLRAAAFRADAGRGRADHDLAARGKRTAVDAFALAEVADARIPPHLARARVERDDVRVRRAEIEPLAVEREPALVERRRALLERMRVLPKQIAGPRIERLHDVAVRLHEDRPVANERHAFRGARGQRPAPREPQVLDVARRDLGE